MNESRYKRISVICTREIAGELVEAFNNTLNAFDATEITGVRVEDYWEET